MIRADDTPAKARNVSDFVPRSVASAFTRLRIRSATLLDAFRFPYKDGAMDDGFDLEQAYAVETPDDNRRLYREWAATYDDGFLETHGYVYHESVVRALGRRLSPETCDGAVADIGCGTGVVGIALRAAGFATVDGVDLSPEMLAVAQTKTADDGTSVYRDLIPADLTEQTSIAADTYAAIVSAGAFTHGHLGPEPIAELVRIARPGATLALGVNAEFFETAGFGDWFGSSLAGGLIADLEVVEAPIYDAERYTAADLDEHAHTVSSVAVFRAT